MVVNKDEGKFASAHDFRRAFGTRWASRVKPPVLQRLMRHRNIQTTLNYYVALDADDIADELWQSSRLLALLLALAKNPPHGTSPAMPTQMKKPVARQRVKKRRRARESNPQPVARHLISNQTANHSLTLRNIDTPNYSWSAVPVNVPL